MHLFNSFSGAIKKKKYDGRLNNNYHIPINTYRATRIKISQSYV